jgi:hypothetical protein
MATEPLVARLRKLGRRLLSVCLVAGAGWGLASAVVLLLACIWLDLLWELPPALRLASMGGALAAVLLCMAGAAALARRCGRPRRLARTLDHILQSGGEIGAGADFALEARPMPPLSAGLAELAVRRAQRLALGVRGPQVVPLRPVYWSFGGVAALAAVVSMAAFGMPRLAWTQWLRFSDPFGDHPPFSRVEFTVEPGDTRVVYGAGLDIRVATAGESVERLDLVLQNDGARVETLPMFPESSGQWRATLSNVTSAGRYFVRCHAGRSQSFRIDLITVPRLEAVRVRITPPAYTNRPAYEGLLPQGGLAGLPGTQVRLWIKSNRPLSGGALEVKSAGSKNDSSLTPDQAGAAEVSGTFEIRKAGKLQARVTDIAGQPSTDVFTAPITVLKDERPFIRLIEPPPVSLATPDAALPVVLAAEDDYGIARVQLFRSLNDSRALPLDLAVPVPAPTRRNDTVRLPLAAYGLTPGDEIKLFARVEDNDPAGPNGAESTFAVVRIISVEDFQRLVRARQGMEMFLSKYRQAQRRAARLAEDVERLRKKAKDLTAKAKEADKLRIELDQLADQLRKEADAIRQAARNELPYDLDKELKRHLDGMARQLERLSETSRKMAASNLSPGEMAHLLERMLAELGQQRDELEREALAPLEHLEHILPLLEDAARFVILYERQKSLADRLRSLKDRDRPGEPDVRARLRDFQSEQEELRGTLMRLLDDIEDHVTRLPEDPTLATFRSDALDFVKKVRASGAAEAMSDAEAGLGEFSGSRGYAGARRAADILEKFVDRARGGGGLMAKGQICLRFQPRLAAQLGDTVAQMLADMGLDAGPGQGAGGGSSARRSTMENVGLYGALPTLGEAESSGDSQGDLEAGAGSRRQTERGAAQPLGGANARPAQAAGAAEAAVPLSYRRRVGAYFERIADETGGHRNPP